LKFYIT